MTIEKKLLGTSPSGDAANVADVFSTFLYKGTGSNQTINNGIDLAGEGGLIWIKAREDTVGHALFDTVRGVHEMLVTNTNAGQDNKNTSVTAFNSNGFNLGSGYEVNEAAPNEEYVSWTFRKKEKFFDIVTFTGNSSTQTIAHNLGGPVGMIIIKTSSHTDDWNVWHRSIPTNHLRFDTAAKRNDITGGTAPTDTHFTLNSNNGYNGSGRTYIAYVFGDDSSEDADNQMIKCGSFTSSSANQVINLGWEPQFVLIKSSSNAMSWYIFDTMRGIVTGGNDSILAPNDALAEETASQYIDVTPTGFISHFNALAGSRDYIYMAIRAPMMKKPEAATEVFKTLLRAGTNGTASVTGVGFPLDVLISRGRNNLGNTAVWNRLFLPSKVLHTNEAEPLINRTGKLTSFDQDGFSVGADNEHIVNSSNENFVYNLFKRAKGFMDVVTYTGNATARVIPHSLGVVPEMIWVKKSSASKSWSVYHKDLTSTGQFLSLDNTYADTSNSNFWNNGVDHTSTTFSIHTTGYVNSANATYISYLFATLAGISKVGSYTGNGSYQTISCGFSAGSRFVLIKRTDATGDWYVWDSVRGIVAGNDPHLHLNDTPAEVTSNDSIDPHNSGFIVNQVSATNINVSSGTYIFYAIA